MVGAHAWWGACMVGGMCGRVMHGRGACMAGVHVWQEGHVWWGHAWQGGMHGGGMCGGVACRVGACMMGGMHDRGTCIAGACEMPAGRYYEIRSISGRYASYWNAFLFLKEATFLAASITSPFQVPFSSCDPHFISLG